MANWKEYTTKSAVEDTDELMIADATANVNKRTPLSILWNWIVGKLTSAVIANLETNSKSVVGALNELNSKALSILSSTVTINDHTLDVQLPLGSTETGVIFLFFEKSPHIYGSAVINYGTEYNCNVISFAGANISNGRWNFSTKSFSCTVDVTGITEIRARALILK